MYNIDNNVEVYNYDIGMVLYQKAKTVQNHEH